MPYLLLSFAILAEVIATSCLKASDGFTRLLPSGVAVSGYLIAFYLLSLVLRTVPIGVAYAIWSGAGVALVAIIGATFFHQRLDAVAWFGIAMIVAGVLLLNLVSRSPVE